jgi:hypothetical protein
MKLLGIISVGFGIRDQPLIRFSASFRCWAKNESTRRQYISYSLTSRKPMIQLGGKYCTIEFGVLFKFVILIKICLKETYSEARIGKYLSDSFPI